MRQKRAQKRSNYGFRRLKQNRAAFFGLIILIVLVLCAIFADVIAPNHPNPSPPELSIALKPGFWSEEGIAGMPLGTDALGRCVLSRIIYGTRVSLSAGLVAVGIAMILGIALGTIAGFFGVGSFDDLVDAGRVREAGGKRYVVDEHLAAVEERFATEPDFERLSMEDASFNPSWIVEQEDKVYRECRNPVLQLLLLQWHIND